MASNKFRSTDDFDPLSFRPHGRVNFIIEGNILINDAVGPFNKELIEAIESIEIDLIHELKSKGKWGDIVVITGSAMGSSETLTALTGYLKKLASAGLVSDISALVIDDQVEGAGVMTPHIIKAYAEAGIALTVFHTVNEARVWVKLHL